MTSSKSTRAFSSRRAQSHKLGRYTRRFQIISRHRVSTMLDHQPQSTGTSTVIKSERRIRDPSRTITVLQNRRFPGWNLKACDSGGPVFDHMSGGDLPSSVIRKGGPARWFLEGKDAEGALYRISLYITWCLLTVQFIHLFCTGGPRLTF